MKTLLAIDEGTTSTRALLMDEKLNVVADSAAEFTQSFPQPGWVEHDLDEIWKKVLKTIKNVTLKSDPKNIAAIGITNQRETICFWDRKSGEPLAPAIVWQDRRTSQICNEMKTKGMEPFFTENTGLVMDPYFSGTKVAWALKNWDRVKQALKNGTVAVGTIDSYLIARLAGGGVHVTEPSNASRTLAFHLHKHRWDTELCSALGIPTQIWPEIRPSMGIFANTAGLKIIPDGIPITGALGDQQASLLGQACIHDGNAKCTYGTGAFMLLNTGKKPAKSRHRLLTTVAWALDEKNYTYALEGSAFIAGAAVQWLRDGLKFIKKSSEIEKLANEVSSCEGVTFVPALTGLGAPHWNPEATGMFTGLSRGSNKAHMARAVLEGIAFQNADILIAMEKDLGSPLRSLNVDGGAAANNLLMQMQADILGVHLRRSQMLESTALGAIFAAGIGVGLWSDLHAIEETWKMEREFKPTLSEEGREAMLKRWNHAVAQANLKNPARSK